MVNKLVTAVIPAYQRPKKTQRAIDSVADQTYSPLELIVVDDGSSPPLTDRLELPTALDSQLIRFDKNRGANVARNTGIEYANGDFIAFLDSDDEWKSEKIEHQVNALQRSNAQASYTSVEQVDADGNLNGVSRVGRSGDLRPLLLAGNEIGTFSSFMIATNAIIDIGTPDPDLPCWQDWEWYLRLSESIEFVGIEEVLVSKHNEGDRISRSFAEKRKQAYPSLRERLMQVARTDEERKTALAHLDFELGYAALANHEFQTARSHLLAAIRRRPRNLKFYKFLAVSGPQYPAAKKLKRLIVRNILS